MGLAGFAAAIGGLALLGVALLRVGRAAAASMRFLRDCRALGVAVPLGRELSAWLLEHDAPVLALAGVIRPRLVVSRGVIRALSREQLEAAARHEAAHYRAMDNAKRCCFLLSPHPPFAQGLRDIESAWARFAEWAADQRAAGGDQRRALLLAEALVRVVRLGSSPFRSALQAQFMADECGLAERVEKLLRMEAPPREPSLRVKALAGTLIFVVLLTLCAAFTHPATQYSFHRLLEELVR